MKLTGAAPAATFRRCLVALTLAMLAVAGCSVDRSGQQADKPTIRIGYQTFPSGDLIVKNNRWLETRCRTTTSSGPSSTPAPT